MILDLDAGNTRLKWRVVDSQGVPLSRGAQSAGDPLEALLPQASAPQRIRVACVRDTLFRDQLQARINACWGLEAEFAKSQRLCAGVVSAYAQPEKLGVDRWLTLLAARARQQQACCIIDAGSALTVDLLRGDGQHLGGYIVPGLAMQRVSLLERTAIRLTAAAAWEDLTPGASTSAAIHNGIMSMIVAWLVAMSEPVLHSGGKVYLTGGDAQVLSAHLEARSIPYELVADLVLEGLAAALP